MKHVLLVGLLTFSSFHILKAQEYIGDSVINRVLSQVFSDSSIVSVLPSTKTIQVNYAFGRMKRAVCCPIDSNYILYFDSERRQQGEEETLNDSMAIAFNWIGGDEGEELVNYGVYVTNTTRFSMNEAFVNLKIIVEIDEKTVSAYCRSFKIHRNPSNSGNWKCELVSYCTMEIDRKFGYYYLSLPCF